MIEPIKAVPDGATPAKDGGGPSDTVAGPRGRSRRRPAVYAALLLADVVAIAAGYLTANAIYFGDPFARHGLGMIAAIVPAYLAVAFIDNLYCIDTLIHPRARIWQALRSLVFAVALTVTVAYFLKTSAEFSRVVMALGLLLSPSFLVFARLAFARTLARRGLHRLFNTVVIVDDQPYRQRQDERVLTCEAIGFWPASQEPAQFHRLALAIADCDRLVIATPERRVQQWASILKGLNCRGEILVGSSAIDHAIGFDTLHGEKTLLVAVGPIGWQGRLVKRLFDLAIVIPALLLLLPVVAGIAIAIRRESRGRILFVQQRVGRDNRLFYMLKFRSMFTESADATAATLTQRDDPRVTRVGAFIRRTSLDELPQLWNVLRGDMSIVGPRPHALGATAGDTLYWDVDPRYRHRHSIKPGLTGLAQVRGFRGNTERHVDLTNRLKADLEYCDNWSLGGDIRIIVATVAVLVHANAY